MDPGPQPLNPLSGGIARLRRLFLGKVARSASGNFLLTVASTGLGMVTTFTLARILGASGYGGYSYALSWVNILCIPALLGFEKLLVREVAGFRSAGQWGLMRGLLQAANGITLVLSVAIGAAAAGAAWMLRGHLAPELVTPTVAAMALVPILSLTGLRRAAMGGLHRVVTGEIPDLAVRPVLLLLALLSAYFLFGVDLTATWAIGCNIATSLAAFFVGAWLLTRTVGPEVRRATPEYRMRPWLWSAVPLALLGGLQVINQRVGTVLLGAMTDAESVGIYNVALQVSALITFVTVAVDGVTSPYIARFYSEGNMAELQRMVTKATRAVFGLAALAAVALVAVGVPVLSIFGTEFTKGYGALAVLCLGKLAPAAIGPVGVILTMVRLERLALRSALAAVVVNIVLNLLLVPRLGAMGTAIAAVTTSGSWFALNAFLVYRKVGIVPTVWGRRRGTP